jgi:hypothetical protein
VTTNAPRSCPRLLASLPVGDWALAISVDVLTCLLERLADTGCRSRAGCRAVPRQLPKQIASGCGCQGLAARGRCDLTQPPTGRDNPELAASWMAVN